MPDAASFTVSAQLVPAPPDSRVQASAVDDLFFHRTGCSRLRACQMLQGILVR